MTEGWVNGSVVGKPAVTMCHTQEAAANSVGDMAGGTPTDGGAVESRAWTLSLGTLGVGPTASSPGPLLRRKGPSLCCSFLDGISQGGWEAANRKGDWLSSLGVR